MPVLKRWNGSGWDTISGPPGASDLTTHTSAADPHTGYVLESLFTTKGDIVTATGGSAVSRLGVGADGTVLMAASGQSTGLQWAVTGDIPKSQFAAKGDLISATAASTPSTLASSAVLGQALIVDPSTTTGLKWANGSVAARSSAVNIGNTETQVIGYTIPANTLRVGSVFRIKAMGLFTNTTTGTTAVWRIRMGTTTLTGNIPAGVSTATGIVARTSIPFIVEAMVTVLTTGASGTAFGALFPEIGASGASVVIPLTAPITASVVVDSTAAKIIELTFISGGATTTANFLAASIVQEA